VSTGRAQSEVASAIEERELRAWVEQCLGAYVVDFERHPLAESTSFACERLTASSGERAVELFFKDYGRCRLARGSRAGIRREIEVYRRLLDPELLGTPRHVGSLREPEDGRSWLLLENVRGARLADLGFEHWLAAAAWLGRLQGHAARHGISERPPACLVVHDLANLRSIAEEAVCVVASIDGVLERRLRETLDGHEGILERQDAQPRTLVHGSFRPDNILVDVAATPPRVAPVDWEHAALGCALYDVAFLSAGLVREEVEALLAAQRASAAEFGLRLPEGDEAWELVTILRLQKALRSLGRALRWSYERESIERLITLVGRLRIELRMPREKPGRRKVHVPTEVADPETVLDAWRSLGRTERVTGVELILGRSFGRKGRAVYRLRIDAPQLASVVAKFSHRASLARERLVYTELLPRVTPSAPGYVGWVEGDGASWLFLEDVGSLRFSLEDQAHRDCTMSWLGAMHAAGTSIERDARVPERGSGWFLAILEEARESLLSAVDDAALSPVDRTGLRVVIDICQRAASRWKRIEAACASMPRTLVHADFQPKNLFLRPGSGGLTLLPIDWEYAGWGVPALDLGTILRKGFTATDLAAYARASGWDAAPLPRWVSVGRALRAVLAIRWATVVVEPFPDKPLRNLPYYGIDLERAFEELASA
jgi:aminoglycoside phosphotransferase (APT) family kinase protein